MDIAREKWRSARTAGPSQMRGVDRGRVEISSSWSVSTNQWHQHTVDDLKQHLVVNLRD